MADTCNECGAFWKAHPPSGACPAPAHRNIVLMTVDVSAGLFSSERTVRFNSVDGEVSTFVSEGQIQDGRLKVYLLEEDDNFACIQIQLQDESVTAKVRRDLIWRVQRATRTPTQEGPQGLYAMLREELELAPSKS